jgi:hypothetical protein
VAYQPHVFHLLDALEYDIIHVADQAHIVGIYLLYFPDSLLNLVPFEPIRFGGTAFGKNRIAFDANIAHYLDPGGSARMKVFLPNARRAAKRFPVLSPLLAEELLQKILTEPHELEEAEKPDVEEPCFAKEVPRSGKNSVHDDFADFVTGRRWDFLIKPPGDPKGCQTDGFDEKDPKLVWEVKTKHEWVTDYGITESIFAPLFNRERIFKLEEQRARCNRVTKHCGFRYQYAFDDPIVAADVRRFWGNNPPVVYRKNPNQ